MHRTYKQCLMVMRDKNMLRILEQFIRLKFNRIAFQQQL